MGAFLQMSMQCSGVNMAEYTTSGDMIIKSVGDRISVLQNPAQDNKWRSRTTMQNTFHRPLPESIPPPAPSAWAEVGHFRWMLNLAAGLQNGRSTIQNTEDFLQTQKGDILNVSSYLAANVSLTCSCWDTLLCSQAALFQSRSSWRLSHLI